MTQIQPREAGARTGKPPFGEPVGSIRLTGRGAIVTMFAGCLLGLLFAAWTGWSGPAHAVFVLGCVVIAYYTRPSGLRHVVVCPPPVFFAACVCSQALTSDGAFSFLEGILVTLGLAAPWLFIGTALAIVIAAGRGFRPRLPRR
jgi:hypothetical protein